MTTTTVTVCPDLKKSQPWRHAWLAALAILAIVCFSPLSLTAQVVDPRSTPGRDKIQTDLLAKLESESQSEPTKASELPAARYKIIVSLQGPGSGADKAPADPGGAGPSQMRQQVAAAQNAVLQTPISGSLTVLYRYHNLFAFAAMADRAAILSLVAQGAVVYIEEMPVMYKMDVESHAQTHVNNIHQAGFTGKGVTIAIIDDGIDASHVAFGGSAAWPHSKILGGYDFADNDADPRIDCVAQRHGTAVAGVAAGKGGGILGTAPDANLVFLKIQSAATCGGDVLNGDVSAAIDWVVTNRERYGIDIISMSFGHGAFSSVCDGMSLLHQAVNAAYDAGIIAFAAAGNEAQINAISSPACLSNTISVGAVYDDRLGAASFSTCTDIATYADLVTCYSNSAGMLDLLAPSHCAYTARAGGGTDDCFGGTSAATPFAAGVAATLLEAAGDALNNDQMRHILVESGVALSDRKSDWITPRIAADAALQALRSGKPIAEPPLCTNCVPYPDLSGHPDRVDRR